MSEHKAGCFCGAVEVALDGAPEAMGYCHCESCRHWSAGPINAFTLWKPEAVKITKGAEKLSTYNKTDRSYRRWCTTCGGHVLTEHPGMGLTDVYAAVIKGLRFEPQLHVHYGESVLPVADGLLKQKDLPAELGGTGTILAE
ncbi:MAG TPA: GFA family protein [Polyangia bacterium]